MSTKYIMASSALLLIAAGLICSFFPQELAVWLEISSDQIVPMILKIAGALYFAFGMVNWTAKETLLGGIYGRPVVIGNMSHFVIGALALLKGVSLQSHPPAVIVITVIYTIYAIVFGWIFFRTPAQN
jgi:uncharacterized membrane protein YoaK (UPF0700 family)